MKAIAFAGLIIGLYGCVDLRFTGAVLDEYVDKPFKDYVVNNGPPHTMTTIDEGLNLATYERVWARSGGRGGTCVINLQVNEAGIIKGHSHAGCANLGYANGIQ